MHKHNDFPVDLLIELVRYDPDTGYLFWRDRTSKHFDLPSEKLGRALNCWNSRYAGNEINDVLPSGHLGLHINIGGKRRRMLAHRAAWAIHSGAWPKDLIDHIDGCPSNNRIDNLRECSHSENNRNKRKTSKNTSGFVGVTLYKRTGKWRAWVRIEGKTISLGYHDKKEDAIAARMDADAKYGFHEARRYEGAA